ncbi:MAG: hypothetical protein HQL95_16485 [Magnetococcales bacterium]|nr:hypothetical protein [Magnetococcales bacterium]
MGVCLLLTAGGTAVAWAGSTPEHRACLLEHVKSAKSALAAQYLQQACARRHPGERADPTLAIRPEREDELVAYDQCLFKQLSGVANDASAQGMEQFCRDQFHPGETGETRTAPSGGPLDWLRVIDGAPKSRPDSPGAPRIDGDSFVPLTPAKGGR